ncbi:MAG: nitrogen fixation protein NifQ, partial [Motiliproteus sp.]
GMRDQHYQQLQGYQLAHPNSPPLAEILSSWQAGLGVLPDWLGLSPQDFSQLQKFHFGPIISLRNQPLASKLDHRLDDLRLDLLKLLQLHARDDSNTVRWVGELIATACQGSDHLWQDLGVWDRTSLSALLQHNFPTLAAKNSRDMKWKKFLFKQLCETEGIYTCRAPTCDECADFDDCFGAED